MNTKWEPPYKARAISRSIKPETWNVQDVEVADSTGNIVTTYTYTYSHGLPFYPFCLKGQWYALYSDKYTTSSVMKLPDGTKVWGEKPESYGFCPVEFYVPAYQEIKFGGDRTGKFTGTFTTDPEEFEEPGYVKEHDWTIEPVGYMDFGFVCGCIWGDDSSWKVEFLDLSKLDQGIVVHDARFGYAEMHRGSKLRDSVEVLWPGASPDKVGIRLYTAHDYHLDGTYPWDPDKEDAK